MKVLIADDHPVVRRGVKQILIDELSPCDVVEAQTAAEVQGFLRAGEWDIVVLDMSLPDRSGLDLLKDIKVDHPSLPVIILSMHPEEQFAVRVLRAGAVGYVTKESASEELVAAIRMGLSGQRYLSPALARRLALESIELPRQQPVSSSLTDREVQVLCMTAEGKTLAEIADTLSLSVKTISTYRARLLEKLDAETTADLVRHAITMGYVKK